MSFQCEASQAGDHEKNRRANPGRLVVLHQGHYDKGRGKASLNKAQLRAEAISTWLMISVTSPEHLVEDMVSTITLTVSN